VRELTTVDKLQRLMEALGQASQGPGRVYFVGGSTAVLEGWRSSTKDVDLKLDPEPPGVFEAIRRLKDELHINIELAAPDQFIPAVPGWESRSRYIGAVAQVEFLHYDPVGQALAKIERGHAQDRADVLAMHRGGLIDPDGLADGFAAIQKELVRYPALDAEAFAAKVESMLTQLRANDQADPDGD